MESQHLKTYSKPLVLQNPFI